MGYCMGGEFSWLGMGLGIIIQFGLAALVILGAISLYKSTFGNTKSSHSTDMEILRQRYAKGELSSEDFQRMKNEIK